MTRNTSTSFTRRSSRSTTPQEATLPKNQPTLTSYLTRSKSSSSRNLSKSILLSCTPEIIVNEQNEIVEGAVSGVKGPHTTPKQKAKGRRLSLSPKSSTSLKNKLSKLKHEISVETKAPESSTLPLDTLDGTVSDILVNKLIHGQQSELIEIPSKEKEEQEELKVESGNVTVRINELKKEALSTDVSLKRWITDHKASIDLHKSVEEHKEEDEGDEPPPLDDISAQPILIASPVIPALLTPHALAIAERLSIPRSILRLAIPQTISFLETLLGNIDNVISLAVSRSQPAIFAKLIRPLELMLGKRVTSEHISQINLLWPEAYKTEPCRVIHDGKRIQSFRFQLFHVFTHDQLLERRVQFRWNSIKFVNGEHQKHLQSIGIEPIDVDKLQSWHKHFDLESIFIPPEEKSTVEGVAQGTPTSQPITPSTPLKHQAMNSSTPSTLLERIKAKQLLQQHQQMLIKPKLHQEHTDYLLSLVDRITVLYSTCNKTTLPLAQVQSKLNISTLIDKNNKDVISELCELVPEWIQMLYTDDVKKTGALLVKVDKSVPIRGIREKISKLLQAKEPSNE